MISYYRYHEISFAFITASARYYSKHADTMSPHAVDDRDADSDVVGA